MIGRWLGAAFVVCFLTGPISHGLQDQLSALPQHTEVLPISCVEGWSASAHWTGVRVRDLLEPAGAQAGARLRVVSLERHGGYATTEVEGSYARDPLTR